MVEGQGASSGLQEFKGILIMFWCQILQHTFRGLLTSMLRQVRAAWVAQKGTCKGLGRWLNVYISHTHTCTYTGCLLGWLLSEGERNAFIIHLVHISHAKSISRASILFLFFSLYVSCLPQGHFKGSIYTPILLLVPCSLKWEHGEESLFCPFAFVA